MERKYPSTDNDIMLFSEEHAGETTVSSDDKERWNIMIVDDDDDVHHITRMILSNYSFDGRGAHLIHSHSAADALSLLEKHPDTALILMDVIMETDQAGLDLVHQIRQSLGMTDVRILIRTGQPGRFCEYQVAREYDINEYKEKSNLTSKKLLAAITTLLREYASRQRLHKRNKELENNIDQLKQLVGIFDKSMIAALVLDEELCITTANSAFTKLTGFNLESIQGKTPEFLNSEKNNEELLYATWYNLLETGSWEGELWCMTNSDEDINIQLSATKLSGDGEKLSGIALQFTDITKIKENERKLLRLATHDTLTSLPNRALFFNRLEDAIANTYRSGNMFALLFIDLDYFKRINDEMGHKYGDQLLKQVGERLSSSVRNIDTMARIGGDEFAAIVTNITAKEQVKDIAKKINQILTTSFSLNENQISISGSIGIAFFPTDATDVEQLCHLADLAMYKAKSKGRNTYCFFSTEYDTVIPQDIE